MNIFVRICLAALFSTDEMKDTDTLRGIPW